MKTILPKECVGRLFATRKPINRPGWWKGNFALFQMLATWVEGSRGRVVDICSKADFPQWQEGQELLQTEVERWWGTTCKNSTVISDSHLQTGHRWSNQHHLQIGHRWPNQRHLQTGHRRSNQRHLQTGHRWSHQRHLQTGHRWSNQHPLGCFRYS